MTKNLEQTSLPRVSRMFVTRRDWDKWNEAWITQFSLEDSSMPWLFTR